MLQKARICLENRAIGSTFAICCRCSCCCCFMCGNKKCRRRGAGPGGSFTALLLLLAQWLLLFLRSCCCGCFIVATTAAAAVCTIGVSVCVSRVWPFLKLNISCFLIFMTYLGMAPISAQQVLLLPLYLSGPHFLGFPRAFHWPCNPSPPRLC